MLVSKRQFKVNYSGLLKYELCKEKYSKIIEPQKKKSINNILSSMTNKYSKVFWLEEKKYLKKYFCLGGPKKSMKKSIKV